MKHQNQIFLITGSSRGVGRDIAEYYLNQGATVLGISRSSSSLDFDRYHHWVCDISNQKQVLEIFSDIKRQFGKLDVLINNAGQLAVFNSLLMPVKLVEGMINTNFLGNFLISRAAVRLMLPNKFGRVIQISSMAEILEPIGDAVYSATKAASTSLSNSFAKEFASYGITFNTLSITQYDTDMSRKVNKRVLEETINALPLARGAIFSDIINVLNFYIDSQSGGITSQYIALGGLHK